MARRYTVQYFLLNNLGVTRTNSTLRTREKKSDILFDLFVWQLFLFCDNSPLLTLLILVFKEFCYVTLSRNMRDPLKINLSQKTANLLSERLR